MIIKSDIFGDTTKTKYTNKFSPLLNILFLLVVVCVGAVMLYGSLVHPAIHGFVAIIVFILGVSMIDSAIDAFRTINKI